MRHDCALRKWILCGKLNSGESDRGSILNIVWQLPHKFYLWITGEKIFLKKDKINL